MTSHADIPPKSLLERARGGDAEALGHLLESHRGYLGKRARWLAGPGRRGGRDNTDLVQEVLIQAWRRFDGFRGGESKLTAWLRQIQDRLLYNLAQYPSRGCCTSIGEVYPDVQAVAVPLGRLDRGELAAINISFQRRTLNERWLVEEVGQRLSALARRLA